ncbi:MAG TPA: S8 family serine peptidase [Longimicrobiales bacterium]|nr:S8 family serine peptidase [Longimicrobiales bacterium]
MIPAGTGVGVAIIDSGANVPHPHLPSVAGGVAFDVVGEPSDDWVDRLGHGTAVAAAIHEKAPGAELWVVKVFDRRLATSVPALIRAIDWAAERGVHLVNLSLGTPNGARAADLARAVARASERGTLVVSAREHDGRRWYPGSLEGVVGVEIDPDCPREIVRAEVAPGGAAVVRASPYPRPVPGVPRERNLHGISFAVANVTGCLAASLAAGSGPGCAAEAVTALPFL